MQYWSIEYIDSGADLCWALGEIICNFTPILSYFQHWGGWTSTTIMFRCGNLVKTKKKSKWNTFFPKFRWRPPKKSSSRIEHFFSPNSGEDQKKKKKGLQQEQNTFFPKFTIRCTPIQTIVGGDTAKLLGGYIPIPPCFGTPVHRRLHRVAWLCFTRHCIATVTSCLLRQL